MNFDPAFWENKRVLVTGHTGFKGAWLSLWLVAMGSHVRGFANGIPTHPSLYEAASLSDVVESISGDVTDKAALCRAARGTDIAFHLAAQPIVRRSLREPIETWQTNAIGTCSFLEAVRLSEVRSAVAITSDKCYLNPSLRDPSGLHEDDPLGGDAPYSSSKAAAELAVAAWRRAFDLRVATARAGNVIGGGDWSEDRLIPDLVRGTVSGDTVAIRYPDAVRPWQHVLEPLTGYLSLGQALWDDDRFATAFNFGPPPSEVRSVRWVVDRFEHLWPEPLSWEVNCLGDPPEAQTLILDSTKAANTLGWTPTWDLENAIGATVDWYLSHRQGDDVRDVTLAQIANHSRECARREHRLHASTPPSCVTQPDR